MDSLYVIFFPFFFLIKENCLILCSLLQREILEASVYFGLSSAVTEARRLFQQLMSDNLKLSADIRDIVYSTGKYTKYNLFCHNFLS